MRRWHAVLVLAAIAAGCATVPPTPPTSEISAAWQTRQMQLRPVTAWNIQGRLAMRTAAEGWQAALRWVRAGERHDIDLTGPLGRGHWRLTQDRDGAELRDAEQHRWRADSAQQLLYRATGWLVPFEGLHYWVLGLPVPDVAASQELDAQGRLRTLTQSGWDIRFLEYSRYGSFDLPSKLFIKRRNGGAEENAADATLEVRLVIERWMLQ